jgi:hypothetical protein
MMLLAGIALGLSEIFVGEWVAICVVTILYVSIGVVSLVSLFITKKELAPS